MSVPEEEKIFAGVLFSPGDPELKAIKLRSHNLCADYNRTYENDTETRDRLIRQIVGAWGEGSFIQGPVQFHYGVHTKIGKRFFGNFNLMIQDDGLVTIGDDCNFGPNCTIVTPIHPMLPEERYRLKAPDGTPQRVCYANLAQTHGRTSDCVRCSLCERNCPQRLPIRSLLETVAEALEVEDVKCPASSGGSRS